MEFKLLRKFQGHLLGRKRLFGFLCLIMCVIGACMSQITNIYNLHYHGAFKGLLWIYWDLQSSCSPGLALPAAVHFLGSRAVPQARAVAAYNCSLCRDSWLAMSTLHPSGFGRSSCNLPTTTLTAPGKLQLIGRSIPDKSLLLGVVRNTSKPGLPAQLSADRRRNWIKLFIPFCMKHYS